mmetsp:Transcript_3540/g.8759  ORF Transcript_3540/g.8759 Transcript_3540/m.8759 type:complete len:255 (+) Transcript_3540:4364-5128(+)
MRAMTSSIKRAWLGRWSASTSSAGEVKRCFNIAIALIPTLGSGHSSANRYSSSMPLKDLSHTATPPSRVRSRLPPMMFMLMKKDWKLLYPSSVRSIGANTKTFSLKSRSTASNEMQSVAQSLSENQLYPSSRSAAHGAFSMSVDHTEVAARYSNWSHVVVAKNFRKSRRHESARWWVCPLSTMVRVGSRGCPAATRALARSMYRTRLPTTLARMPRAQSSWRSATRRSFVPGSPCAGFSSLTCTIISLMWPSVS